MDEAEDAEYGRDVRGDELPEALRDRKAPRAVGGEGAPGGGAWARGEGRRGIDAGGSGGGAEAEVSALRRLDAAVEAREKVEHDFKERKKSAVAAGGTRRGRYSRGTRRIRTAGS